MTLVAPGGFGPDIASDILSDFADARAAGEIRNALSRMSGPEAKIDPQSAAMIEAERADPALTGELRAICAMIATADGKQGALPPAMLEAFEFPVELVWGSEDPVLPYEHSRNAPAQFDLTTIPGAGHMLLEEAPGRHRRGDRQGGGARRHRELSLEGRLIACEKGRRGRPGLLPNTSRESSPDQSHGFRARRTAEAPDEHADRGGAPGENGCRREIRRRGRDARRRSCAARASRRGSG
jgi:hypothetical protein